ncbi:ComF family protein [Cupriavidus laharis]|nr:ComF family protein [Cupriavidus laharis]
MQGHGKTRQQENREAAAAPAAHGSRTPWRAAGRQVYARAAKAAGQVRGLARALLPCACALCGVVQDEVVCRDCAAELLYPVSRCPVCAMGIAPGQPCAACAQHRPAFDQAFTLGDYALPQDSLVLALKYGKVLPLAGWLAAALAHRVQAALRAGAPMPDLLAPIPLSPRRLAERGFNQAWEIARPLGRDLGIASDPVLLERPRDIATQHLLDLAQRQMNVRGAFRVARPLPLAGMHVGLVDDVMTTGATLDEAAHTLKAHGAARVSVIVALRTP